MLWMLLSAFLSVVMAPGMVIQVSPAAEPVDVQDWSGQVEFAVELLRSEATAAKGRHELMSLSSTEVVPAVIEQVIEQDDVGPLSRQFAYELLQIHKAASSRAGFDAVVDGLDDPLVRSYCIRALISAKPYSVEASRALERCAWRVRDELLAEESPDRAYQDLDIVYRTLWVLREFPESVVTLSEEMLVDPEAPGSLKAAAAAGLVDYSVRTGELETLLGGQLAGAGRMYFLNGIGRYARRSGGAELQAADEYILTSLTASDHSVQRVALATVMVVYGSGSGRERLTRVKGALTELASREGVDEGLKAVAVGYRDRVDSMLSK